MCLFPRFCQAGSLAEPGFAVRPRDRRTLRLIYITISRVPIQCSCKTLTRGSARPAALQDQVTLQGSILCSHLQDDREPRPTKLLRPNSEVNAYARLRDAWLPSFSPYGTPPFRPICGSNVFRVHSQSRFASIRGSHSWSLFLLSEGGRARACPYR
jgi:hypothetical protein